MSVPDLTSVKFGQAVSVAPGGGSATFGQTVISWVPSATSASLQVTVTMGGQQIQQSNLSPTQNQLVYNGTSGQDTSQGALNASFSATGMGGNLYGNLKWNYNGFPNNYSGMIGSWGGGS